MKDFYCGSKMVANIKPLFPLPFLCSLTEGTVCYDSDEAAAFSSLSNRSSPLSWRQGQASPRLQAGEAPSTGNAQSDVPLRINHSSRIRLIEALGDPEPALLKRTYLSNCDLVEKSSNEEEGDDEDEDDDDDVDIDDLGNGYVFFFFFNLNTLKIIEIL